MYTTKLIFFLIDVLFERIPKTVIMSNVGPGQSQEPEASSRSPTWQGPKYLGHLPLHFPQP